MREPQELRFGGYVYTVRPLGAEKSMATFERLIKLVAPGSRGIADAVTVAKTLEALTLVGLPAALSSVLEELKVGTTLELAKVFGPSSNVRVEDFTEGPGPRVDAVLDDHFAGKLSHLYRWLCFCVEVNYGDFFDSAGPAQGVVQKVQALFQKTPSASPSQKA